MIATREKELGGVHARGDGRLALSRSLIISIRNAWRAGEQFIETMK